jgi:hypothetical protein
MVISYSQVHFTLLLTLSINHIGSGITSKYINVIYEYEMSKNCICKKAVYNVVYNANNNLQMSAGSSVETSSEKFNNFTFHVGEIQNLLQSN